MFKTLFCPLSTALLSSPDVNWLFTAFCCAVFWPWGFSETAPSNDPKPERITVGTWNLEWFYDHYLGDNRQDLAKEKSAPTREEWDWKLHETAKVIAKLRPTILCLQEVENQDVVWRLTQRLRDEHDLKYRYAFIQGSDFFTEQDVAIIYRSGLVEFSRREQTLEMFDSKDYYNVNKHLFGTFQWGEGDARQGLTIVTVHFRAMPEHSETRIKQARLIRHWIEDNIRRGENVIVTGDINTEEDWGQQRDDGEMSVLLGTKGNPAHRLTDLHQFLEPDLRPTHLNGRQYDRILVSQPLMEDAGDSRDLVFSRVISRRDLVVRGEGQDTEHFDGYYQIDQSERDLSDHYPVLAEFVFK